MRAVCVCAYVCVRMCMCVWIGVEKDVKIIMGMWLFSIYFGILDH